jgi:hypothetical protein
MVTWSGNVLRCVDGYLLPPSLVVSSAMCKDPTRGGAPEERVRVARGAAANEHRVTRSRVSTSSCFS